MHVSSMYVISVKLTSIQLIFNFQCRALFTTMIYINTTMKFCLKDIIDMAYKKEWTEAAIQRCS